MRLDAVCARATGMSRKESRLAVRSGRVYLNGKCVKNEGAEVAPGDAVTLDGEALDLREHLYLMLNKPAGTVCTADPVPESVLNLLSPALRRRLFCVGRLDKDTTGLLLLTDDGALDHRLMSPKHHAQKVYLATLARPVTEEEKLRLEQGMTLENGEKTLPCKAEPEEDRCRLTLREGKYHQVKRMFAATGNRVTALHREKIGGVPLDPALAPGEYRELTEEELALLSPPVDKTEKM